MKFVFYFKENSLNLLVLSDLPLLFQSSNFFLTENVSAFIIGLWLLPDE